MHEFWKHQIAKYYESRGFRVIMEKPINGGKTVDLSIENHGKKIAIEVETGRSNALWNIEKALKAGFDEVISVAVNDDVLENLKRQIQNIHSGDKIVKTVHAKWYI